MDLREQNEEGEALWTNCSAGMEKNKGAARRLRGATTFPVKFKNFGIEKTHSHRYQMIARIPENESHLSFVIEICFVQGFQVCAQSVDEKFSNRQQCIRML